MDEQIILDLNSLDFDRLSSVPNNALSLVTIIPNLASGKIIWKSKYTNVIDPKSGKTFSLVEQATLEGNEISGQYKSLNLLTRKPKYITGNYRWIAPYVSYSESSLHPYDYLPWSDHDNRFVIGGTVICRINHSLSGSSEFISDAMIPTSWQKYVASALYYHKNHPGLFSANNASKNRDLLTVLLDDSNPFLALDAARCLAQNGLISTEFVPSHVASADIYKQAVFTLLLLYNSTPQTRPILMKQLENLISNAHTASQIKGIALDAFVAQDTVLLAQLDQQISKLDPHDPATEYIVNLLQVAKIRM